ncbi:hypothetical protein O0I10_013354, partial [Lichtheimia ornata]
MSNNNVNRDSLASVNVQPHQGRQSYTISDRKKISVGEVDSFFEEELKECRAWIKPEKVNNMHKLVDPTTGERLPKNSRVKIAWKFSYVCHRAGAQQIRKDRVAGGSSGK